MLKQTASVFSCVCINSPKIGVPLEHVVFTATSEGAKATEKQEESDNLQPVSENPGIMMYQISVCNDANFCHLTR